MRVEHHLLRLARIGSHEEHRAVGKPDVRDLHRRRHARHHDHFVAPVELVRLARIEAYRNERGCRPSRFLALQAPSMTAHDIIAAFVPETAPPVGYSYHSQPFATRLPILLHPTPI